MSVACVRATLVLSNPPSPHRSFHVPSTLPTPPSLPPLPHDVADTSSCPPAALAPHAQRITTRTVRTAHAPDPPFARTATNHVYPSCCIVPRLLRAVNDVGHAPRHRPCPRGLHAVEPRYRGNGTGRPSFALVASLATHRSSFHFPAASSVRRTAPALKTHSPHARATPRVRVSCLGHACNISGTRTTLWPRAKRPVLALYASDTCATPADVRHAPRALNACPPAQGPARMLNTAHACENAQHACDNAIARMFDARTRPQRPGCPRHARSRACSHAHAKPRMLRRHAPHAPSSSPRACAMPGVRAQRPARVHDNPHARMTCPARHDAPYTAQHVRPTPRARARHPVHVYSPASARDKPPACARMPVHGIASARTLIDHPRSAWSRTIPPHPYNNARNAQHPCATSRACARHFHISAPALDGA